MAKLNIKCGFCKKDGNIEGCGKLQCIVLDNDVVVAAHQKCMVRKFCLFPELQLSGSAEDNSMIVFLIHQ